MRVVHTDSRRASERLELTETAERIQMLLNLCCQFAYYILAKINGSSHLSYRHTVIDLHRCAPAPSHGNRVSSSVASCVFIFLAVIILYRLICFVKEAFMFTHFSVISLYNSKLVNTSNSDE